MIASPFTSLLVPTNHVVLLPLTTFAHCPGPFYLGNYATQSATLYSREFKNVVADELRRSEKKKTSQKLAIRHSLKHAAAYENNAHRVMPNARK
jgi:hypothetical protein